MPTLTDNHVIAFDIGGEKYAERCYPAKKEGNYVIAATGADGELCAVHAPPMTKADWRGTHATTSDGENAAICFNPIEEPRTASALGDDGTSAVRDLTWDFFPERTEWHWDVDDICLICNDDYNVSAAGDIVINAGGGFLLRPTDGYINERAGAWIHITAGPYSLHTAMDHDIYPAEFQTIAEAQGFPMVTYNSIISVGWMHDFCNMETFLYPLQAANLKAIGAFVGAGRFNISVYYASNYAPTFP